MVRAVDLVEFYHSKEYENIRVEIGNKTTVHLLPVGSKVWLKFDKDNLRGKVNSMNSGEVLYGIPKEIWIKYLDEPFDYVKKY